MLTYAGTSHRLASLAVRERIAIPAERVPDALGRLTQHFGSGTILATCGRLELYLVGDHGREELLDFIAAEVDADRATIERHFEFQRDGEAVRHLYAVSAGIESMVLGESEILGQVRSAFSLTVKAGADDALLSRLFHTAIRVGRRARTETGIGRHALSISSIAVQQARELVPGLSAATVLVVGAGEAAGLAAASLLDHGVAELLVANRSYDRAQALAADLGGRAFELSRLGEALALADVVIAAADAPQPLISHAAIREAVARREGQPMLIIDIGLPRDVEQSARDEPAVTYMDLDDLQAIATEHAASRAGELPGVRAIVDEETARFLEWWGQLQVVPTIAALTARAEQTRRTELEKTLRRMDLPDELEQRLEAMTRAIVKQILHDPISELRQRGDREIYVDTVRTLFRLDEAAGRPPAP